MNKSTLIALLMFAALAAAAVATLRDKPERGITRISFTAVDPAAVDRVVIQGPNKVELKKSGEQWTADGQRAEPNGVKALLDTIKTIESAELITRSSERYADLGVDDEKGTRVQVFSGAQQGADFIVGSAAQGGANIRVGDAVYVVKRVSKATFARDRAQWLDRKLFADTANDATKIEVKLANQPAYALTKDGEAWKPADGTTLPADFRFDRNAARTLATSLVSAQAKDVLSEDPGAAATGLAEGADTLVFQTAAGEPRTLTIGNKRDDGSVYARSSARAEVVTIPEHLAKNLRKPITDLRDLSLMSFDAATAKRLEIVKDKDRVVFAKDGDWKVVEATPAAPADFAFDPQMVARRLSAIGSARAVAEAEAAAQTGLDKPARKVNITLADDRIITLAFGNETQWDNAAAVYARGNADGKTYLVRPFARDNLLGGVDTFAKREDASPLGGLDPHALSNLPPEVREALMKQMVDKQRQDEMMKRALEQQGQR